MQIEHTENYSLKKDGNAWNSLYIQSTVIESVISKILLCFAVDVTLFFKCKEF